MSRIVNWPIDCSSIKLTGSPAKTRLRRALRKRVILAPLRLLKLNDQMIVKMSTNGITNINEGSLLGSVAMRRINKSNALLAEIMTDRFI